MFMHDFGVQNANANFRDKANFSTRSIQSPREQTYELVNRSSAKSKKITALNLLALNLLQYI